MNHKTKEAIEMLHNEIDLIAMNGNVTEAAVKKLTFLTEPLLKLHKIEMYEEAEEHSERGYARDGRSYDDMSYNENSYARRKRDRMGRYSSDEYARENRSNRSRDGYSGDEKEEMIEHLEDMMSKATSEKERQAFQRCITAIENG